MAGRNKTYDLLDKKQDDHPLLVQRMRSTSIRRKVQRKAEMSQPGDADEVQADELAAQFSRGEDFSLQEMTMQIPSVSGYAGEEQADTSFDDMLGSTMGSGVPLSGEMLELFENRMGADFSDVRIHTSSVSDELSKGINAQAFTIGSDIHFSQGAFDTSSEEGRALIAHELVHTVQQESAGIEKIQREIAPTQIQLLPDDGKTDDEKISWLKRKLKRHYVIIPIANYYARHHTVLRAYSYLVRMQPDVRRKFFEDYPDRIENLMDSMPKEMLEAGNFGFVPGGNQTDHRVTDLLDEPETWDDLNEVHLLLDMLLQQDQVQKVQQYIDAHKNELLDVVKTHASWYGDEEGFDAVFILILGGYGAEARQIVQSVLFVLPSEIAQRLNDLDYSVPGTYKADRSKATLWGVGAAYFRIRATEKREARQKAKKEIKSIRKEKLSYSEKHDKIKQVRETKKKEIDKWKAGNHGMIMHLFGGNSDADLTNFNLAALQNAMNDHISAVSFAERVEPGKKLGAITYHARMDEGIVDITSDGLPFDSINYNTADYSFRTGEGIFGKFSANIRWPGRKGDKEEAKAHEDETGTIELNMDTVEMNRIRVAMRDFEDDKVTVKSDYTYAIGELKLTGLKLKITQSLGPASTMEDGFGFIGRLTDVLLNMGVLLSYALQQTIHRFSPGVGKNAGDELASIMASEFSDSFGLSASFDSLSIKNFLSTSQGLIESLELGYTTVSSNTLSTVTDAQILADKKELLRLRSLSPKKKREPEIRDQIDALEKKIKEHYKTKEYDLKIETHDVKLEDKDFIPNTLNGTSPNSTSDNSFETGKLGSTTIESLRFSTVFSPEKIRDTKVGVTGLEISSLSLSKLKMGDPDMVMSGDGSIQMTGISATMDFTFMDQLSDPVADEKQGIIKSIDITSFGIAETKIQNLSVYLVKLGKKVEFPKDKDLIVRNLNISNVSLVAEQDNNGRTTLKPYRYLFYLPGEISINKGGEPGTKGIEIPEGLRYSSLDQQGKLILGLTADYISARSLDFQVLTDGAIDFSLEDLLGGVTAEYHKGDVSATTHVDLNSKNFGGLKKGNVLTLRSPDIPSVEFDKVEYNTPQMAIRTPANSKASLKNIKANGDVVITLTTDPDDKRPFESLYVPELVVDTLGSNGLEVYMSPKAGENLIRPISKETSTYIIVPEGQHATISKLKFSPFCVENILDANSKTGYKTLLDGTITYGQADDKNAPKGLDITGLQVGSTKSLSGYLNYLNSKSGQIDFSILYAVDPVTNTLVGTQKTAFDLKDIRGEGGLTYKKDGTTITTELDLKSKRLKGSWEDGLLTLDDVDIPSINLDDFVFNSAKLGITTVHSGNAASFKNIKGSGIKVKLQKDTDGWGIESIDVSYLNIQEISAYNLVVRLGSADSEVKVFKFPENEKTKIKGLLLKHFNINAGKKNTGWTLDKNSYAKVDGIDIPKGLEMHVNDELRLQMNHITSDLISFNSLGTKGFEYDINNLDGSGYYTGPSEDDKELNLKFGFDTNKIDGSVQMGVENGRKYMKLISNIDIPKITSTKFHFKSEHAEIELPEQPFRPSHLSGITAAIEIIKYLPTKEEKKAAKDENKEAKSSYSFRFHSLNIHTLKAYGLYILYNQEIKDQNDKVITDKDYAVRFPNDVAATLRRIELKEFNIEVPKDEESKVTFKGEASIGKEDPGQSVMGVDLSSAKIMMTDNITKKFQTVKSTLTVNTILFEDTEDKPFRIFIDDPNGKFAGLTIPFINKTMGGALGKGDEVTTMLAAANPLKTFFRSDYIEITKDKNGDLVTAIKDPVIPPVVIYHGGSSYQLSGRVSGTLTLRNTKADFGNGPEDAFCIETPANVVLGNIEIKLGKSDKEEDEDEGSSVSLAFLQSVYGSIKMDIAGAGEQTLKVSDGKIRVNELKTKLGELMENVIKKNLEWGDNAIEFFEWINDWSGRASLDGYDPFGLLVETWVADLFVGLDDDADDSRDFFAEWVNNEVVNNIKIFTNEGKTKLSTGNIITDEDAIAIGYSSALGGDQGYFGDKSDPGYYPDQTLSLQKLIEYQINAPKEPKKKNPDLPSGWNPDNYKTLEDLFYSLRNNEAFGYQYLWNAGKFPYGKEIAAAIGAWVPSRVGAWILDALTFDINLSGIDLEKIPGFKFNTWFDDDVSVNINKTDEKHINVEDIEIPGFSYTHVDKDTRLKTVIRTDGLLMDRTVLNLSNNKIKNKAILLKGLKILQQKGK